MKKFTIALLSLVILCFMGNAQTTEQKESIVKSLREQLAVATNAQDSIRLLYDIYDLSGRMDHPKIGDLIYQTALRAKNYSVCLDIVRLLSSCYSKDEAYYQLQELISSLPSSREKDETMLFLKMKRLACAGRTISGSDRQHEIAEIITRIDSKKKESKYDKMLNLYSLVTYLRNDANGDLLKKYLDKLTDMVNSNEFEVFAITSLVNSEAANIYSDAGDSKRAVAADKKLLKLIDGLEKSYQEQGRKYRHLEVNRYIAYRRMIRNYEALRGDEAKQYYAKALELAKQSKEVAKDMTDNPYIEAYYRMSQGQYAEAIPNLKKYLQKELPLTVRRQALEMLQKAAHSTGDKETELQAVTEHNAILAQLNALKASEKYKELQIKYDVNDLKQRNAALEIENKNEEIKAAKHIMTFVMFAFIIVAIVLAILMFYWARFQSNAKLMGHIVDNLASERNSLSNSRYYDYADDHDALPEVDRWQYRRKRQNEKNFVVSTFMTECILDDLLYIAAIGRDDCKKEIQQVSLDAIMRQACQRAAENMESHIEINPEYPSHDCDLITDREALVFMLAKMIKAAERRSKTREITISSRVNPDKENSVSFIFTDKGSTFVDGSEQLIFTDFIKAENLLDEDRWGLFFCRIVALLLKSNLIYDRTYSEGTRFTFTVPMNLLDKSCI